ncbi:hypothetical protein LRC204 [Methanocella arvoryzae MRE50]|uniref:Uncharacterized protein n=1 Tax=Methanocella arvoryzae (strain DSM 22066 / NBRC 105507 / MRE50) TaxID=351160 RepID=Q0W8U0_METAR|nr:hypothetical protein LRC204 [Methanocella arvoryzae MRE50]
MRWGLSEIVRTCFIVLLLTCTLLPAIVCLCTCGADARADFSTWANRSSRLVAPADYNTDGTCAGQICSWKGVQGIGNTGIGDGNVSAITNNTTEDETLYPDYVLQGVITIDGAQYPGQAPESTASNSTSGLKIGGEPGIFTYGSPYPGILNEYPVEAAAVYGKLTGLRMPDGRSVSIGIKSIGYEY